jgi:transaldolase
MYVTELVAPDTVNTMPGKTLDAVADHGEIAGETIRGRYDEAAQVLDRLERLGIGYTEVTELLEREGVDKFEKSWAELMQTVTDELDRARARAEGAREEGDK